MNVVKIVFILAFLQFISFSQSTAEMAGDYSVMLYENGWKRIPEDIHKKMNDPIININTEKSFCIKMVNGSADDVLIDTVSTPLEYLKSKQQGNYIISYTTYDVIDQGLFEGVAMPLIYSLQAKSSKHSFVRNFPYSKEDPLSILPANFISAYGSDAETVENAIKQRESWGSLAPNAKLREVSDSKISVYDTFSEDFNSVAEEDRYSGGEPSHIIGPEVVGDLNDDGYEDIVLSYCFRFVGGSGRSYQHVVLTRRAEDEVLEDITEEVNERLLKLDLNLEI